jgi:hypothetical protein
MYARIYCTCHACMPTLSPSIMRGSTWRDNGHKRLMPVVNMFVEHHMSPPGVTVVVVQVRRWVDEAGRGAIETELHSQCYRSSIPPEMDFLLLAHPKHYMYSLPLCNKWRNTDGECMSTCVDHAARAFAHLAGKEWTYTSRRAISNI